jgi:cytochrome c oxidase subunit IV
MSGHVVSVKLYVAIFFALLFFTGLTTAVAFVDLGEYNTVAALAIAFTKMMLVVLFFMHVKYSSGMTKVIVLAGFFWLAILLTFTLSDYFTRAWTPTPSGWGPSISAPPQP